MQKLLRALIILLLLVVLAAIVYTQTQLFTFHSHPPAAGKAETGAQQAVAETAASKKPRPEPASSAVAAAAPSALPTLGTETSPVVVKLVREPESADEAGERYKDREIQRGIERNTARLAATSLAQNFLLLFQAIIYFLTLLILFILLENVKKFADAAGKSADAAKKSAETAEALLKKAEKHAMRKFLPRFYRKR